MLKGLGRLVFVFLLAVFGCQSQVNPSNTVDPSSYCNDTGNMQSKQCEVDIPSSLGGGTMQGWCTVYQGQIITNNMNCSNCWPIVSGGINSEFTPGPGAQPWYCCSGFIGNRGGDEAGCMEMPAGSTYRLTNWW